MIGDCSTCIGLNITTFLFSRHQSVAELCQGGTKTPPPPPEKLKKNLQKKVENTEYQMNLRPNLQHKGVIKSVCLKYGKHILFIVIISLVFYYSFLQLPQQGKDEVKKQMALYNSEENKEQRRKKILKLQERKRKEGMIMSN